TGYQTSNGQFHQFHNESNSPDDEVTSQRRIGQVCQCISTAGNSNPTPTTASAAAAAVDSCVCADTLNYSALFKCEESCSGGKR
ncbi:unnamed protein product, partial [Trichobilharzia szidati]